MDSEFRRAINHNLPQAQRLASRAAELLGLEGRPIDEVADDDVVEEIVHALDVMTGAVQLLDLALGGEDVTVPDAPTPPAASEPRTQHGDFERFLLWRPFQALRSGDDLDAARAVRDALIAMEPLPRELVAVVAALCEVIAEYSAAHGVDDQPSPPRARSRHPFRHSPARFEKRHH
ncbi:MAG: hypothetical protein P4L84_33055 [Isosphaeraceae bacterium]|nr:hypothetical protein [Isosphaeraceae bacterium]